MHFSEHQHHSCHSANACRLFSLPCLPLRNQQSDSVLRTSRIASDCSTDERFLYPRERLFSTDANMWLRNSGKRLSTYGCEILNTASCQRTNGRLISSSASHFHAHKYLRVQRNFAQTIDLFLRLTGEGFQNFNRAKTCQYLFFIVKQVGRREKKWRRETWHFHTRSTSCSLQARRKGDTRTVKISLNYA